MINCCSHNKTQKRCVRKSDEKVFSLPRRFTRKRCQQGIKGYTMRSSCAPYKDCLKQSGGNVKTVIITVPHSECIDQYENVCDQSSLCRAKQIEGILKSKNYNVIFLRPDIHRINCDLNREVCKNTPYIQNFKRILQENPESIHFDVHSYPFTESFKQTINNGIVILTNKKNEEKLNTLKNKYTIIKGGKNYLTNHSSSQGHFSVLLEFFDKKYFTDEEINELLKNLFQANNNSKQSGGVKKFHKSKKQRREKMKNKKLKSKTKSKKQKPQFLYNPNNPKKSFDVYINKNPADTIPIKYTTVEDVKNTIKKLENLYKKGAYPHKRIWQVGMIMKVRLEAMLKHKKTLYPNAKYVKQRYNLANKYFTFLGKRSKVQGTKERKQMVFKI